MRFRRISGDAQAAGRSPTPERSRLGALPDYQPMPCAARARAQADVLLGGWSAHGMGLGFPLATAPRHIHFLQTKPAAALRWLSILVWKASIPPNLLNPPKGHSMAKIARDSLQLAMKSVPVANSLICAQLQQTRTRETVNRRFYTLCEVNNGERQSVPPVLIQAKGANYAG
jgi:hypothetical protein